MRFNLLPTVAIVAVCLVPQSDADAQQCINGMCFARGTQSSMGYSGWVSPQYQQSYQPSYQQSFQPTFQPSRSSWGASFQQSFQTSRPAWGASTISYPAQSYQRIYSYEPAGVWIDGDNGYVDMSQYGGFRDDSESPASCSRPRYSAPSCSRPTQRAANCSKPKQAPKREADPAYQDDLNPDPDYAPAPPPEEYSRKSKKPQMPIAMTADRKPIYDQR